MRRSIRTSASIIAALTLAAVTPLVGPVAPAVGQATCAVFPTPVFSGVVPTPDDVLGAPIGDHQLTSDEIYDYMDAVDAASARVRTGSYGTTAMSNDLRYAVVGPAAEITDQALEDTADAIRTIQDPATPDDQARALAEDTRAFLFIGGNVHGNEESGADGSMELLWHLADRTDCAAQRVRNNAIVVILPMQNPDGRDLGYRRNANGFDMNRDGQVMTQVEIFGRWQLLRRFPPQLFVDAHEFGYTRSFFPPNDDPIYHEASRSVLHWVADEFGPALADLFEERGWGYFNAGGYDFFAPIYGDTSPAFAFQAPGLTLETNSGANIALRAQKNFEQFWVLLRTAVDGRARLLASQHEAFQEALRQGRQGLLEPNRVFREHSHLLQQVPDIRVRNYFLIPGQGSDWALGRLLSMLREANVEVHQLDAPLRVRDFVPYGGEEGRATIPAGAFWIPAAQAQKHWVQTMLNADTYTPVRSTYDITGWSLPIIADVDGGWSGKAVTPDATALGTVPVPAWPLGGVAGTDVAVFESAKGVYAWEGARQLEWLMDDLWDVPRPDALTPPDIIGGALDGYEVLVMPSGGSLAAMRRLGDDGIRTLKRWVRDGGHFVGYKYGGTTFAPRIGLSSAELIDSPTGIDEGALVRIDMEPGPVRAGIGRDAWAMFADDDVLLATPRATAASYPGLARFDSSGLVLGLDGLPGSSAIVDEAFGDGRVTIFGFDANFRGFTWGTQRILWNVLFGPEPHLSQASASALARARASARGVVDATPEPWRD